jgi:dihydrodipicolinate synthase/N-acetylneuraminate lyase
MPHPPGLAGLGVALITLFDRQEHLDANASAEHALRLVELGVQMVLVCGTTGEAQCLSDDERRELIGAVREMIPRSVPVLAGTGAITADRAASLTTQARETGADAILALSPPGSENLMGYYNAVRIAAVDLPVLAYHCPIVSEPGIPVELLPELPVVGLKDSSRDAARIEAELRWSGLVFVGSTTMLEIAHTQGAAGAILGLANAQPEACAAALRGDADARDAVLRAGRAAGGSPREMKAATAERFGTSATTRLKSS